MDSAEDITWRLVSTPPLPETGRPLPAPVESVRSPQVGVEKAPMNLPSREDKETFIGNEYGVPVLRPYQYCGSGGSESSCGDDDYFDRESSMYIRDVLARPASEEGASEAEVFYIDDSQVDKLELRIRNLVKELLSTEEKYVSDLDVLCHYFEDMRYSIIESCESFLSFPDTVGMDVALRQIFALNSQFLERLSHARVAGDAAVLSRKSVSVLPNTSPEADNTLREAFLITIYVLECWALFVPMFTVYADVMSRHGAVLQRFEKLRETDKSFYLYSTELVQKYEESFDSLMIKPVQRLPRYVMLAAELRTAVDHLASSVGAGGMRGVSRELAQHAAALAVEESESLVTCTRKCNDLIRIYQDNIALHKMYRSVKEGDVQSDFSASSLVSPHRQLIKEGCLKRHHKHSGLRSHAFHLFTDVLLCSDAAPDIDERAVSQEAGKSNAALEFKDGSEVLCLSIPPFLAADPDVWFLLSGKRKSLFIAAATVTEKERWIDALQTCIEQNKCYGETDDLLYLTKQVALVNSLLYVLERREEQKTPVAKKIDSIARSFEYLGRNSADGMWVELSEPGSSSTEGKDITEGYAHLDDCVVEDIRGAISPNTVEENVFDLNTPQSPESKIRIPTHRRASTGVMVKNLWTSAVGDPTSAVLEGEESVSRAHIAGDSGQLDPTSTIPTSKHLRRASTGTCPVAKKVQKSVNVAPSDNVHFRVLTAMSIQVSWWQLLDIATADSDALLWRTSFASDDFSDDQASDPALAHAAALREVAEENSRCIVHNIISLFADDSAGSKDILSKLLIDGNSHYIVASGWFFESSYGTSRGESTDQFNSPDDRKTFLRPRILRLFLFHDRVIVGSTHDISKSNFGLHFHCELENMVVDDFRDGGVSDCAIMLSEEIETKLVTRLPLVSSITRRLSRQRKYRSALLYAPSRSVKFEWISLLIEAIRVFKSRRQRSYRSINPEAIEKIVSSPNKPLWYTPPSPS